ncbi:MAG: hypothetical protein J6R10_01070 [Tidjanibacter sp.]|nr:hypothetical protein [Tidjanibacter sp.]
MKTSELVFNYLREQGFRPQIEEGKRIVFEYQNGTFIYFFNDDDESFFQLALPGILQVTDANRYMALEAISKLALDRKVIKGGLMGDRVWLLAEILLDHTPDVADLMPRLLNMLMGGWDFFNKAMR